MSDIREEYRRRSDERMNASLAKMAAAVASWRDELPELPEDSGGEESFVKYRCGEDSA